jgi:transposase
MRANKTTYTDEFRSDAVSLCRLGDRSRMQVARDLGVNHRTLRDWYGLDEMKRSKKKPRSTSVTPPTDETPEDKIQRLERELVRLQRVNAQLEMDREILRKAAAFFAKESE